MEKFEMEITITHEYTHTDSILRMYVYIFFF